MKKGKSGGMKPMKKGGKDSGFVTGPGKTMKQCK